MTGPTDELAARIAAAATARRLGPHVVTYSAKRSLVAWNVALAAVDLATVGVAARKVADGHADWWPLLVLFAALTAWAVAGIVAAVGARGVRVAVYAGGLVHRDRRGVTTAVCWHELGAMHRRWGLGHANGRKDMVAPVHEIRLVDERVLRIETWMFPFGAADEAAEAVRRGLEAHRWTRW